MSNYVPNMTEVREAYQFANKDKDEWVAFDEFHLWIEKLQADFVKGAEERIIKLLEVWWETDQELEELIDIIKGENK